MEIVKHHTSLEKSTSVEDTLNWKLVELSKENKPTDTGIADYIAFAVKNLEQQVKYIGDMEKEIKEKKKAINDQIDKIKIEGAKFFENNGIVRIDGVVCSSITVIPAKQESVKAEKVQEFIPLISQAEIEELLIGLGKAEMRTVEKEKTTKATPAKLKINKRTSKKAA